MRQGRKSNQGKGELSLWVDGTQSHQELERQSRTLILELNVLEVEEALFTHQLLSALS